MSPFAALEKASEGLIALTAGGEGAVVRLLADGQKDKAATYLDRLQALFPDRLYIEIIRRNDPAEEASEDALIDLAFERNLPIVATNPAAYADPSFHAAHDAMLCIAQSAYIESNERQTSSPEAWLKDSAAMAELFVDLPEALGEHRDHRPALRSGRAEAATDSPAPVRSRGRAASRRCIFRP